MAIPARRLETAIQFVMSDPAASSAWSARVLGVEPTPCAVPSVRFDEHAYPMLAPGRLVTLFDPDGTLIGFIDNTRGGMPDPR